jgi:benzylsuccinate CoA-transferase BbsF subunit
MPSLGYPLALPLRGVRVLDFTWHGAGPYTTKMLADHGADVIRVETSKRLDSLRNLPPFKNKIKGVNRSGYFSDRNSNKRDIVLNLKHPAARDIALRLIEQSDVVANNFTPGTMASLGLGYQDACAVRPDIVYIEMAMQGAYGPDAEQVGFGLTVSALTGLHHLSGAPGQAPVGTGTNYPDHISAPGHATIAVLAALRHRRRTGRGQYIDLAQTETMVSLLGPSVLDWTVNRHNQTPQANLDEAAAPHGVYPCAGEDRWIAIAASTDDQWCGLLQELGALALADDPRFATLVERHRHQAALDAEIARATCGRDAFELMERLQRRGVPAGVVETAQDLLERDPQLRARGHFAVLDHPEMGPSVYNAPPFRLCSVAEPVMRTPAPLLGQHTREVCRELLGLGEEQIDRLTADEVLV